MNTIKKGDLVLARSLFFNTGIQDVVAEQTPGLVLEVKDYTATYGSTVVAASSHHVLVSDGHVWFMEADELELVQR